MNVADDAWNEIAATGSADDDITDLDRFDRPLAVLGEDHRPGRKALIAVTDNHHVLMIGGEHQDDLVLGGVRVLVLVDEDVLEPLLVLAQHIGMMPEEE